MIQRRHVRSYAPVAVTGCTIINLLVDVTFKLTLMMAEKGNAERVTAFRGTLVRLAKLELCEPCGLAPLRGRRGPGLHLLLGVMGVLVPPGDLFPLLPPSWHLVVPAISLAH
jgi:hypothetical protein